MNYYAADIDDVTLGFDSPCTQIPIFAAHDLDDAWIEARRRAGTATVHRVQAIDTGVVILALFALRIDTMTNEARMLAHANDETVDDYTQRIAREDVARSRAMREAVDSIFASALMGLTASTSFRRLEWYAKRTYSDAGTIATPVA